MRANFQRDAGDLWIFIENGDVEEIEEGIETDIQDLSNSDLDEGRIHVSYDPEYSMTQPGVARSNGDLDVIIGDSVYNRLLSGGSYTGRAGEYQELHQDSYVRILAEEEMEGYEDMFEELEK